MMKLFYSLKSPFARKVRVVALEKGLHDEIQLIEGHPLNDPPELLEKNPLGKVPALVTEKLGTLYDSKVICEYLDGLNETPRLIPTGEDRMKVLNAAALSDGVLDAAVALILERARPEAFQYSPYIDRQKAKISGALALFEKSWHGLPKRLNLGHIGIAVTLEYLSRRNAELAEITADQDLQGLMATCTEFALRPSMMETSFPAYDPA